jgi:hypothetical protein
MRRLSPVQRTHGVALHTCNTIYVVDATSFCVAVIDRRTGRQLPRHLLVGCFLAGGRRDTHDGFEYEKRPRVGWCATFQKRSEKPNGTLDLELIVTSCVQAILPL